MAGGEEVHERVGQGSDGMRPLSRYFHISGDASTSTARQALVKMVL